MAARQTPRPARRRAAHKRPATQRPPGTPDTPGALPRAACRDTPDTPHPHALAGAPSVSHHTPLSGELDGLDGSPRRPESGLVVARKEDDANVLQDVPAPGVEGGRFGVEREVIQVGQRATQRQDPMATSACSRMLVSAEQESGRASRPTRLMHTTPPSTSTISCGIRDR